MTRPIRKLSARAVVTIRKPGRHSDGGGLYLSVDATATSSRRRWVFIFTRFGKTREMGLGSTQNVSLSRARQLADEARDLVAAGQDPIEVRRSARKAATAKKTFGEVADALIESKAVAWRNGKHRAQWVMTIRRYAASLLHRAVDEIDTKAVLAVLHPIWQTKPETASRVRGRIEAVLDAARALGYIPADRANPARWRGHLDALLPKRHRLSRGHHAAMDYAEVPGLMLRLQGRASLAARALELLILTAARSGEILGAKWSEIDLAAKVWTVPASRMKGARAHRVPLSPRALAILSELSVARTSEYVFPGATNEKPLSAMSLSMLLRRLGLTDITVHGFRSSFRDWAGNETTFARELAEAALSHRVGDKAEQAYRRQDALERRRSLMDAWSSYCLEMHRAPHVKGRSNTATTAVLHPGHIAT